MGKIIKLDKDLINQISAGEVVERPASVVKELVENSIDAQAKNIKIEILKGGKRSIIVSDDGIGISKDDLKICLEKYTTSKIKSLSDLYNILTFGFRGEALSSISSVSQMSINSKTEDSLVSYKLDYSNETGKIITKSSHGVGTTIIVNNLFYNTPARLNYLKQDKTEYLKILSYLQNAVLSYPEIGFEFISDEKRIFKYNSGETLKTRIYEIYGNEVSDNILDVNFEIVGIKIYGYISDPKINFINKSRQHIFVNRRPISSVIISKAVIDAYNRFIPHGTYPFYVLNIDIDPTLIDVNVHPRKSEIRFENEQNIFKAVYNAVLNKLENVSLLNTKSEDNKSVSLTKQLIDSSSKSSNKYFTSSGANFKEFSPYKNLSVNPNQISIKDSINFTAGLLSDNAIKKSEDKIDTQDLHFTKLGKIVGQAYNSYIIIENEGKIIILDQHALHERIIYEKLLKQEKNSTSQKLIIPENIKLTPSELQIITENKSIFEDMGFEIELLSNSIVSIYSIPDFIKKEKLNEIFLEILGDLDKGNLKSKSLQEVRNKIFAYTACRSAIKFGNKLNLFEMNKLLNDSLDLYSSTCPHGRPVIYEITLDDLKNKYER